MDVSEYRRDREQQPWLDPIESFFPVGYDGEVVEDVYNVMACLLVRQGIYYTDIAAQLSLDPKYVHLILEVANDRGATGCGTSPRGSWLEDAGIEVMRDAKAWRESGRAEGNGGPR